MPLLSPFTSLFLLPKPQQTREKANLHPPPPPPPFSFENSTSCASPQSFCWELGSCHQLWGKRWKWTGLSRTPWHGEGVCISPAIPCPCPPPPPGATSHLPLQLRAHFGAVWGVLNTQSGKTSSLSTSCRAVGDSLTAGFSSCFPFPFPHHFSLLSSLPLLLHFSPSFYFLPFLILLTQKSSTRPINQVLFFTTSITLPCPKSEASPLSVLLPLPPLLSLVFHLEYFAWLLYV